MITIDQFSVIRSQRKTISVSLLPHKGLILKIPYKLTLDRVKRFIDKNQTAIQKFIDRTEQRHILDRNLLRNDFNKFQAINKIKEQYDLIAPRAKELGLYTDKPIRFKIMKSRWGSCSSSGIITFNIMLGLLDNDLVQSVIAHELCHLRYMNHSRDFYQLLISLEPNCKINDKKIKKYLIN